jgi:transposase
MLKHTKTLRQDDCRKQWPSPLPRGQKEIEPGSWCLISSVLLSEV